MNTEEFTSELYDRHLINYLINIYSICRSAQRIQLAGSPFLFGQNIYLEQVYIDLDVEQIVLSDFDDAVSQNNEISVYFSRRPLLRRLSVIEAIKGTPDSHIILLGIPGSGKTIFLNHLALCLAGAALAKHGISGVPADIASLKALPNWDAGILLPIYVDVVRLAAFIVNNGLKTGSIATIFTIYRRRFESRRRINRNAKELFR